MPTFPKRKVGRRKGGRGRQRRHTEWISPQPQHPTQPKRYRLSHDPVLSRLPAEHENRMIDIPFTHWVPTPARGHVAPELARQLKELAAPPPH